MKKQNKEQELPLYPFHLNAFEMGVLAMAMKQSRLKMRKQLSDEIETHFKVPKQ